MSTYPSWISASLPFSHTDGDWQLKSVAPSRHAYAHAPQEMGLFTLACSNHVISHSFINCGRKLHWWTVVNVTGSLLPPGPVTSSLSLTSTKQAKQAWRTRGGAADHKYAAGIRLTGSPVLSIVILVVTSYGLEESEINIHTYTYQRAS